ncbi:PTS system fructose-specific EIIABC component [Brevibacillus agri]|uniref:PTS fructose transporter subunit IIA n=1 Tax=Brevibacillus agri TaxID=51101 RepID=A0A3M8BCC7_9BACL|nr:MULTISPECIES: fructose-specific PTS transporter subunit EIIC [Brevibacillus]QAV11418.1 PTS fructose transporter subunit IIA [Brevibacillus agri]QHZ58777.1 PTS transporter subunit EIIA [Brevibacillus sp. NSP2.1]RNB60505.1 PTS fructose transporter subunit IIA [Brevibacillus agri]GED28757.1 PTS system fructose-specific EIIABC component [Brevibacillus agri]
MNNKIRIGDLLNSDTIVVHLSATTKEAVLDELIEQLDKAGRLNDKDGMKQAILAREAQGSTGIGEGIAIPHAKTAAVKTPAIAYGFSKEGVEFDSLDQQKAHLFFMIAATEDANQAHLATLALLSQMLMDESFRQELMKAETKERVLEIITNKEKELESEDESVTEDVAADQQHVSAKVVAVTACPTGIAHTYMAADALKKKAAELGISLKVETNGSGGVKNKLTSSDIEEAAAVIVAADRQVEMERFVGKVLIEVPVAEGIRNAEDLLQRAVNQRGSVYRGSATNYQEKIQEGKDAKKSKQPAFYRHLMNGVSNMLPFVVGGGIIIAISFLFGINASDPNDPSFHPLAKVLMDIGGKTAFQLMIPVLAGFIASSIADRPGFAPGMVGGLLATTSGSGFLGGIIAGFLAGYIVLGLKKLFVGLPQSLEGIKPMLLYPLLGTLITGFIMVYIVSDPVAAANTALGNLLKNMGTGNAVILGVILGAMMAFDMGGPVNKAAFTFGIAMIAEGNYAPHAAIMAAGMTPPLGIALATTLFKKKFTAEERHAGKTAYVLGASFITEGAIPFAAADPTRIIPSIMAGSAVAGGLSMLFGCTLPAPHGGLFVLPVVGNWPLYLVSIVAGVIVTALMIKVLKKDMAE